MSKIFELSSLDRISLKRVIELVIESFLPLLLTILQVTHIFDDVIDDRTNDSDGIQRLRNRREHHRRGRRGRQHCHRLLDRHLLSDRTGRKCSARNMRIKQRTTQ